MPPLKNARIELGDSDDKRQRYHIRADQGYVKADHMHADNSYEISFYRAHVTGMGYGKELLQLAKEHAKSLGATAVTAGNISTEESAGAMSAVFGREHLTSGIGTAENSPWIELFSRVTLHYLIRDSDPTLRADVPVDTTTPPPASTSAIYTFWNNRPTE